MEFQPVQTHTSHSERLGRPAGQSRAFSLLELVVVTALIVLMITFLASALGRASISARQTASQRSAEAIAVSVEHFRIEFGFLPPLVHDGEIISTGDSDYIPVQPDGSPYPEGPTERHTGGVYDYSTLIVWSEGSDFNFFRRRDGLSADEVESTSGGSWDIESAWDDRRYSRYALAYYLAGALPRSVDGVAGQGMSRPLANGGFANVGYPVGSTRDRYQPTIDTSRNGVDIRTGYARPVEIAEHFPSTDLDSLSPDLVYNLYANEDQDRLIALVDNFGTAYRYYRWEPGRYDAGRRLVVESTLDLNIPPILLDPLTLVELENDDTNAQEYDLTNGNLELRNARFAIVGAGADGLFGTEPIAYLVSKLNRPDPGGDPEEIARLRQRAMDDNVIALGK